jgi:hypothetical protein
LLPIIGIVLLFIYPWWIGAGLIVVGIIMMPILQKTAAQFVLEHALEDAAFFKAMQDLEVLHVTERA